MVELVYNTEQFFLVVVLFLYSFFFILTEWKRDTIYAFITALMSLALGIYLLYNAGGVLHTIFGVSVILIAIYLSFMGLMWSFSGYREGE